MQTPDADAATGMPEGWTLIDSVTVFKALDEDGIVRLFYDKTFNLPVWEAVGMTQFLMDGLRIDLQAAMMEADEDDDDATG